MEKIYFIIQINMATITDFISLFTFFIFTVILWDFIFLGLMCWIIWLRDKKIEIEYEKEEDEEESDLPDNNLVEFMWEDENGNGIYKLK